MIAVETLMLLAFALYFLVSISVIIWGYRYAKRRWRRGWAGGLLTAFLMYNLLFWDWIPVLVMHKYYCAKEAGFWVYKSPEQWIRENPELVGEKWGSFDTPWHKLNQNKTYLDGSKWSRGWFASNVYWEITQSNPWHAIGKREMKFIDAKNGQMLAHSVEFYRGNQGALAMGASSLTDYKIWLSVGKRVCGPSNEKAGFSSQLDAYIDEIGKFERGEKQ